MLRLEQPIQSVKFSNIDAGLAPTRQDRPLPAESVLTRALAELREFQADALLETQEDLSFALGGRLRDARRGQPGQDSVRGRVLMHKLVAELASVKAVDLDDLLGSAEWLRAPQMLAALQAQTPDPGRAALQLAAWLAHGRPDVRLRQKLTSALAELTDDDSLALSLFGALEFGSPTPALRQELVRLFHRASAPRQKISQWLSALGAPDERQRKLRVMLRVLAYELSASGQPIVGSHLAAVIGDLKQLLCILSVDSYCDQAANRLALPDLSGETLLRGVVTLVEQIWVTAENIIEALPIVSGEQCYRVTDTLAKLVQILPDGCFVDPDQKEQLQEAITGIRDGSLE